MSRFAFIRHQAKLLSRLISFATCLGTSFIFLLFLGLSNRLTAQPDIEQLHFYDRNHSNSDLFADVYVTINGDYLLCGQSDYDPWLIRANAQGRIIWQYATGGSRLNTVIELDDGSVVSAGTIGDGQFSAIKLSADGNLIWNQAYGRGAVYAVIELKEGDLIMAGQISDGQNLHAHIVRVTPDGQSVWNRAYEPGVHSFFGTMRETDGGVVAAGLYFDGNTYHDWIHKVNLNGDVIWSRNYDFQGGEIGFRSMVSNHEGGFTLAGTSSGGVCTKINAEGDVVSQHSLHLANVPYLACLDKTPDGGYVFVGERSNRCFVVKTNSDAEIQWQTDFEGVLAGGNLDQLLSVIALPGGELVAAGCAYDEHGSQTSDGMLVKFAVENPFPIIFYRFPEDTLLYALPGDSLTFIVRARNTMGYNMVNQWILGDSLLGRDTSQIIGFDSIGDYRVKCLITAAEQWTSEVAWTVLVRDLFIASHTPDTLSLALRRGSTVNFSIDSVAATPGDPVNYAWTLTDLGNGQQEDAGAEPRATVNFRRSGNYALEGYVFRGESSDAVTWNIAVRSTVLDFRPEQQTLSVPLDTTVGFEVIPFEPADTTLRYLWLVDGDSVGKDSSDSVKFTEAAGGQAGRLPYAVTAIVSDSSDADTIVWNITVVRPNSAARPVFQLSAFSFQFSPNPVNASTTINFSLPKPGVASMVLYNIAGREVERIWQGWSQAGNRRIVLNASNLPAGVYLLRLAAAEGTTCRKLVVLK